MRAAVIDIGTNSTRLLIADIAAEAVTEIVRRSKVTALGTNMSRSNKLDREAVLRVTETLREYRMLIDERGVERCRAVATSVVRDASDGASFTASLEDAFAIPFEVISGEREALFTFNGATALRDSHSDRAIVIDIGGGSTEYICGHGRKPDYFKSLQLGVLRQNERHLINDPPTENEIDELSGKVNELITFELDRQQIGAPDAAYAVGGTGTSMAAIDLKLEPYDSKKIEGHTVSLEVCLQIRAMLASIPLEQRRKIPGLHPDRAPTIIAGATILIESMRALSLREIAASEHDLLYGVLLEMAA